MRNISFDNPWLLIAFVPMVLLLVIPYVIAIKRGNRAKAPKISLALHIVICLLVTLALAGMSTTTVMTETNVFVVADVSYSSSRNLDLIDEYIVELQDKLPRNSKIGIVCFGKDVTLLTEMGGEIKSVSEVSVDASATDIASALNYTAELFPEDVIKRIVLISDGKETNNDGSIGLINAIESLSNANIAIDAIYLDNNIGEDAKEIQLSDVEFTKSTYLGRDNSVSVLVQSTYDTQATLELTKNGTLYSQKAVNLTRGYNIVNFRLDTSSEGENNYEVQINGQETDESDLNNSYSFTQSVSGKIKVMLVTTRADDVDKVASIYGDSAEIVSFVNDRNIPTTVEELCEYDEIILSSVDVRELNNVSAFIDSLHKAVFNFGKSLVTAGDLSLQNKTSDDLNMLEDMLPISYGNNDNNPKLYTLVLDCSRSMQMASRLIMTKEAAIQLLDLIQPTDHIAIVAFSGDVTVMQAPVPASNKGALIEMIQGIQPSQGTFIGKSLSVANDLMKDLPYDNKQVMLISDGMSYSLENDNPVQVAKSLRSNGIRVSTINPRSAEGASTLQSIASSGGGRYYEIQDEEKIKEFIYDEMADVITETVIESMSAVRIDKPNDDLLHGIGAVPSVLGYVYSKHKPTANTVLSVNYPNSDIYSPLYSYWEYGSGKVSCLTTSLTGRWAQLWTEDSNGFTFLSNVSTAITPDERIDYPYTLSVRFDGIDASVEIIPASLNPYATVEVTITSPDGTSETRMLTFDSTKYFCDFKTSEIGKYTIDVKYTNGGNIFISSEVIDIPYPPEYNMFALYDSSSLFSAIRDRGTVSEGSVPEIVNDEKRVATYTLSFVIPFLIAAIALFVIDIIIRKLKWRDIVTLINKLKSKGGVSV